jgi:hypothetical protein
MNDFEFKQVPKQALQFSVGECQFKDNGDEAKTAPFKMVARTGDPISHWYWGNVVHDNAGMQVHKSRLTIDYNHNDEEVIGYANKIENVNGDLLASGVIQSFNGNDRAAEVIFRAKQGQPYEASITHDADVVLEEVPENYTVTVNERQVNGPALIIREWSLRGIAVCPYGADKNTSTELKEQETINVKIMKYAEQEQPCVEAVEVVEAVEAVEPAVEATEVVEGSEGQEEIQATEELEVAPVVEAAAVEAAAVEAVDDGESQDVEPLKEVELIQPVVELAMQPEVHVMDAEKEALKAEVELLKNKLASVANFGEQKPITFNAEVVDPEKDAFEQRKQQFSKVASDGVAAYAASLKLRK